MKTQNFFNSSYTRFCILFFLLLFLVGCSVEEHWARDNLNYYRIAPQWWTQLFVNTNLKEEDLLKRICAFSVPWYWVTLLVYSIINPGYTERLIHELEIPKDKPEGFLSIIFGFAIIWIMLGLFTLLLSASIALISYAITGDSVYYINLAFIFFCFITIAIIFAALAIFAPLLEMIREGSYVRQFLGVTATIIEVAGMLLTINEIIKFFSK